MKHLTSFRLAAALALGFAAYGAQAGIKTNGITQNGITQNGITTNALNSNGAARCDGESQHPLCRHDAIRGLSERPLGLQRRADSD